MAVNEDISAYSTAAASNTPANSDTVGPDLDDHLRDIKKNLRLVGESAQGPTAPSAFRGRLWIDTSGTASSKLLLKVYDGSAWVTMCEINDDNERINLTGAGINSLSDPITIAQGGTGAESTGSAITALGLGPPLAIAKGGTGGESTGSAISALGIPDSLSGMIEVPGVKDYVLDQYAGYKYRLDAVYARCDTGSASFRLLINSATAAMATFTADPTERTGSPSSSNTVHGGDTLILSLTSATIAANLSFSLVGKRL